MIISKRNYNLAYYKKTPNIEELKMPLTLHYSKRQDCYQSSQERFEIFDTTEIGE